MHAYETQLSGRRDESLLICIRSIGESVVSRYRPIPTAFTQRINHHTQAWRVFSSTAEFFVLFSEVMTLYIYWEKQQFNLLIAPGQH